MSGFGGSYLPILGTDKDETPTLLWYAVVSRKEDFGGNGVSEAIKNLEDFVKDCPVSE
jgi:hypothetical protein